MKYPYNQKNLIEEPEKYMYTKFHGIKFIQSFIDSRKKIKNQIIEENPSDYSFYPILYQTSQELDKYLSNKYPQYLDELNKNLYLPNIFKKNTIKNEINKLKPIDSFSVNKEVNTNILLKTLFYSILNDNKKKSKTNKIWLDRLIQRFEVTKKLYEGYFAGFRKGYGKNNIIENYLLLGVILEVAYIKNNKIKYLNTILKICDLITSLSEKRLNQKIPYFGLRILLNIETIFIKILLDDKRIEYDNE